MHDDYHYPFDNNLLYLKFDDWKKKINWKDSNLKLRTLSKEEEDSVYHNPDTLINY